VLTLGKREGQHHLLPPVLNSSATKSNAGSYFPPCPTCRIRFDTSS
jgi:hypothetical protein